MTQETAEIVRGWFVRLSAGDPAPDLCDSSIEIRNWAESPVPGPYRGHDGLLEWWRDVHDPDMGLEMEYLLWGSIVSVRNGKISSAHGFPSREQALEAAGLAG